MTEPACGFDLASEIDSGSNSKTVANCVVRPVCGPSVTNESFCPVMPARAEVDVEQVEVEPVITGPASSVGDDADLSMTSIAPSSIPGLAPRNRTSRQTVAPATEVPARRVRAQPRPVRAQPVPVAEVPTRQPPAQPRRVRAEPVPIAEAPVQQPGPAQPDPGQTQPAPAQMDEVGTTRRGPTRPANFPAARASSIPTAPVVRPVADLGPPDTNTQPVRARREGQGLVDQAERHREALRLARAKALAQRQANRPPERPLAEAPADQPAAASPAVVADPVSMQAARPRWELTGLEPVQDSIVEIDGEQWAWENGNSCSIGN